MTQESVMHKSNIVLEHHEQYFTTKFDPKKFSFKFCPRALLKSN